MAEGLRFSQASLGLNMFPVVGSLGLRYPALIDDDGVAFENWSYSTVCWMSSHVFERSMRYKAG